MRIISTLAVSGAFLCGVTGTTIAGVISDVSYCTQSQTQEAVEAYNEMIAVEEPLSADELAAAQKAAIQLATIDASGEVVLPRVKTTRTVWVPKVEFFAPPESVLIDAKRYVHYFCECWKAEDYERMYYAMSPAYRTRVSYAEFAKRFTEHAEMTGGLSDERIKKDILIVPQGLELTVTLTFRWNTVPERTIKALIVQTAKGYRLEEAGLIPQTY